MSATTVKRPARRPARDTAESWREWKDNYGADARTGRHVARAQGAVQRGDGLISAARLRELANLTGRGVVASMTSGHEVRSGWGVFAHPVREQRIGDRVTATDVMDYVRENWDLLSRPGALLSIRREARGGDALLNVVVVVHDRTRAMQQSRVHRAAQLLDMQNGRPTRVA
jgi:hypothetical protein